RPPFLSSPSSRRACNAAEFGERLRQELQDRAALQVGEHLAVRSSVGAVRLAQDIEPGEAASRPVTLAGNARGGMEGESLHAGRAAGERGGWTSRDGHGNSA